MYQKLIFTDYIFIYYIFNILYSGTQFKILFYYVLNVWVICKSEERQLWIALRLELCSIKERGVCASISNKDNVDLIGRFSLFYHA